MSRVETIGRATDRITAIYMLCEYPSWRPRYVGKTVQYLHERHKSHISDARRGGDRPVHRWLRKQIANNQRLAIKLIEYVRPGDDWAAREQFWIAKFRQDFGSMLNLTDGGEGLHGHVHTPEHREKISAALRTGSFFYCETCAAQFWRKRIEISKGNYRFCSRNCYAASLKGISRAVSALTTLRGVAAAALVRLAKTECKRGHPLSGVNLFRTTAGGRGCKECRKIHKATFRGKSNG